MHNLTLSLTAQENRALNGWCSLLNGCQQDLNITKDKAIWSILDIFFVTAHDDPDRVNSLMLSRIAQRFPVRKVNVDHWLTRVQAGLLPKPEQVPNLPVEPRAGEHTYREFRFHEDFSVRATEVDGQIWFIAKDVCDALSIVNARQAVEALDEDEKGVCNVYTLGGAQDMKTINESGFYALVLRSRKPKAKIFRKWVTSEVIPSIRRTGKYDPSQEEQDPQLDILNQALKYHQAKKKHDSDSK